MGKESKFSHEGIDKLRKRTFEKIIKRDFMVSDKQVQLIVLCDPLYYLSSGIGLLLAVLGFK